VRNVADKSCKKKIKAHMLFSITFFFNYVICEVKWRNILEPDRPQVTIWRMHIASWMPKTHTHNM
jgi:hypothetical protein